MTFGVTLPTWNPGGEFCNFLYVRFIVPSIEPTFTLFLGLVGISAHLLVVMKLWVLLIIFLLGLALGLSVPSLAPQYLGSYFPKIMKPSGQEVKGAVVKKQTKPNRLLLTISSREGAILATFKKKIPEISLLVDEGDTITLAVEVYAPFVTDPRILRVNKPEASLPTSASPQNPGSPASRPTLEEPDSILEESLSTTQESPQTSPPSP